jgi:hypothetical protein
LDDHDPTDLEELRHWATLLVGGIALAIIVVGSVVLALYG